MTRADVLDRMTSEQAFLIPPRTLVLSHRAVRDLTIDDMRTLESRYDVRVTSGIPLPPTHRQAKRRLRAKMRTRRKGDRAGRPL